MCTLRCVHCIFTMFRVQGLYYSVQCSVYSAHCTLYSIRPFHSFIRFAGARVGTYIRNVCLLMTRLRGQEIWLKRARKENISSQILTNCKEAFSVSRQIKIKYFDVVDEQSFSTCICRWARRLEVLSTLAETTADELFQSTSSARPRLHISPQDRKGTNVEGGRWHFGLTFCQEVNIKTPARLLRRLL